jgi:predicted nucleic acid-binding protein
VYTVGRDEPLAKLGHRVVEAVVAGRVEATTIVGVIQEFAHVASRRRGRVDAASLARHYGRLLRPLRQEEPDDLEVALTLFERHAMLGSFDALLAAVAIRHGDTILSPDQGFANIPALRHADLTGVALDELIGE